MDEAAAELETPVEPTRIPSVIDFVTDVSTLLPLPRPTPSEEALKNSTLDDPLGTKPNPAANLARIAKASAPEAAGDLEGRQEA